MSLKTAWASKNQGITLQKCKTLRKQYDREGPQKTASHNPQNYKYMVDKKPKVRSGRETRVGHQERKQLVEAILTKLRA